MEIDIRKEKDDEKVDIIRWADKGIIRNMDNESCAIFDFNADYIDISIQDIDNLILALKKYKELYGGNE